MYADINGKYYAENKKAGMETAKEEQGDDWDGQTVAFSEIKENVEYVEFLDGFLTFDVSCDLGRFGITLKIDDELAFQIVDWLKGRGEKIQRLVKLSEGK